MTGKRKRLARLALAAVLVLPLVVITSAPSVAVTKADVEAAAHQIDVVNGELEAVVEQFNQAQNQLSAARNHLAAAKKAMDQAKSEETAALGELSKRAIQAYTGMGSQVNVLLGAQDLSQFSDRLEFMGALAQNDADLATAADNARQKAEWATQQYNAAVGQAQREVSAVQSKREQINGLLAQAKQLYAQTSQAYKDQLARQRAAAAAAAKAAQERNNNGESTPGSPPSSPPGGSPPPPGGGGGPPPPPVGQGASAAIQAAVAAIGSPYVFGTAGPDTFDCSGLTMWAWAHGGVSLPHSSAGQYAVLPHVSYSDVQPGDLLFFYSPISHVALYIGGGVMIHARHPGPGGEVQYTTVSTYGTPVTGVARP